VEALEAERTIEAQGRVENLEELVNVAREYDANTPEGSVEGFVQDKSLVADADSLEEDQGRVTLMTIHNAKGLEYPVVFMTGMEESQFPHSRAIEEGNVEEERRLAYVGFTRAMRDLTLTYARQRGGYGGPPKPTVRSRFLNELPAELTDQPARIARGFPAPGRVASWAGAANAAAEFGGESAPSFHLGQDVVHTKLGDGVVTGIEPGGIVVVRFAGEPADRKLMAEYLRSARA
jgi:DNA helicase II / ATP-dependent DNA helicase PcrA